MAWSVVYKRAVNHDGSLLFPEKLTHEFLEAQKRKLGSYSFSNQYQNEIIPEDMQSFKKNWFKTCNELPKRLFHFAMIDPAIGQKKTSDYTGTIVIATDTDSNWYVRVANRERKTPTQIVNSCFEIQKQFGCLAIGVEAVAYQEALIYMLSEEMLRRRVMIPIKAIKPPTDRTKEARIRGLVPRYEFGRIYHSPGLYDLESELLTFPRSSHDDLCDPLSSMDEFVTYPDKEKEYEGRIPTTADPDYERYYIRQKLKTSRQTSED